MHINQLPQPLFIQQTRSAHWIAAQYLVLCDGLMEGYFFQLCHHMLLLAFVIVLGGLEAGG
jgi:hypothetical protein